MNKRDYKHPECAIEVTVVRRGVDLVLKQDGKTAVSELTQDGVVALAHALMWRAGVSGITIRKDGGMSVSMRSPHPFKEAWDGPLVAASQEDEE